MEFEGRITKVLPVRSGTSQRGNEWKILPFVFAYYENPDQRWEDRVLLETFDTNVMAQIAKYCEVGADKKVVVENGSVKLKTLDIKCKCGFSHNVEEVPKRDGSGMATINKLRCYRLEIHDAVAHPQTQQPAQQATVQAVQQPFPPQVDNFGYPIQPSKPGDDDLPF